MPRLPMGDSGFAGLLALETAVLRLRLQLLPSAADVIEQALIAFADVVVGVVDDLNTVLPYATRLPIS